MALAAPRSGSHFPHRNAKQPQEAAKRAQLMRRLRGHEGFMCDMCKVYGQDFVCLGYEVPAACLESRCTLRPALQEAMRMVGKGQMREPPDST